MTSIYMTADNQGGFSARTSRDGARRIEDVGIVAGGKNEVPPAKAERPRNWLSRLVETFAKPVDSNYENP